MSDPILKPKTNPLAQNTILMKPPYNLSIIIRLMLSPTNKFPATMLPWTIDHFTLIHHLSSWFVLSDTVLAWFSFYLASRAFSVSTDCHNSSILPLFAVTQDSILGFIIVNMHNTKLSTLVSQSSLSYHLYADDTHLVISHSKNLPSHSPILTPLYHSSLSGWLPISYL